MISVYVRIAEITIMGWVTQPTLSPPRSKSRITQNSHDNETFFDFYTESNEEFGYTAIEEITYSHLSGS
jgi:hypothetical protein